MELIKKCILILLISSSLNLSFFVEAICGPRNSTLLAPSPSPISNSPIPSPSSITDAPCEAEAPADSGVEQTSSPPSPFSTDVPSSDPELKKICGATDYPEECLNSVTPYLTGSTDPISVLKMEMQALRKGFEDAIALAKDMSKDPSTSNWVKGCLETCLDVYDSGVYDLNDAFAAISAHDIGRLNTLLSAQISYASSCDDAFSEEPGTDSPLMKIDEELTMLASNTLAIAALLHWN